MLLPRHLLMCSIFCLMVVSQRQPQDQGPLFEFVRWMNEQEASIEDAEKARSPSAAQSNDNPESNGNVGNDRYNAVDLRGIPHRYIQVDRSGEHVNPDYDRNDGIVQHYDRLNVDETSERNDREPLSRQPLTQAQSTAKSKANPGSHGKVGNERYTVVDSENTPLRNSRQRVTPEHDSNDDQYQYYRFHFGGTPERNHQKPTYYYSRTPERDHHILQAEYAPLRNDELPPSIHSLTSSADSAAVNDRSIPNNRRGPPGGKGQEPQPIRLAHSRDNNVDGNSGYNRANVQETTPGGNSNVQKYNFNLGGTDVTVNLRGASGRNRQETRSNSQRTRQGGSSNNNRRRQRRKKNPRRSRRPPAPPRNVTSRKMTIERVWKKNDAVLNKR